MEGSDLGIPNQKISGSNELEVLTVEGWKQYEWLLHGFSTRSGGISQVYGGSTLNLGWKKEDDSTSVAENRRRFLRAGCGDNFAFGLVGVRQGHLRHLAGGEKGGGGLVRWAESAE